MQHLPFDPETADLQINNLHSVLNVPETKSVFTNKAHSFLTKNTLWTVFSLTLNC